MRKRREELRENVIIAAIRWRHRGHPCESQEYDLEDAIDALEAHGAAAITGAGARSVKGAPETSAAAAGLAEPIQNSARHRVVVMLNRQPGTDDELERRSGNSHQTISSARNWLVEAGWVRDSGIRRKTRSNREAVVWELTPDAITQLMKGGSKRT